MRPDPQSGSCNQAVKVKNAPGAVSAPGALACQKSPLTDFLTAPAVGYFASGKITCSQKPAAAVFWCDGASDSRRACVARQRMSHGAACGADRRSAAVLLYPNRSICFGSEEDEQRNEQALPPCGGARDTELARTKLPCSSVFLHRSTVF